MEQRTAIPSLLKRSVPWEGSWERAGCDGCGAPHSAQGALPGKSWVVLWDGEMRSGQHWAAGARFGTPRLPKQQAQGFPGFG